MVGRAGGSGRWWRRASLAAAAAMAAACMVNRPSTGATRPGPETTTVSAAPRDTLFARALSAMRGNGFTEVSPDPAAGEVRGKSPHGVQVRITLSASRDSTQVRIRSEGEPRGPGIDSQAMATVLALASAISAPDGAASDSSLARPDSIRP